MDRFLTCAAYHIIASRWHSGQSSKGYAVLSRLDNIDYRPSPVEPAKWSDERVAAARLLWARRHEVRRSW